ncbi:MAG: hypothetical protein QM640_17490 [Niabella sp.]
MFEQQEEESIFEDKLLDRSEDGILQISKWTKLISVIGFALGAFIVILMIGSGSQILRKAAELFPVKGNSVYGAMVAAFFVLFFTAALLLYYLYGAATALQQGLRQKSNTLLVQGFTNLRNFFIVLIVLGLFQLLSNMLINIF